ncbi:unnamed protein product [Polarella glacialis]|uniref:NAD(P)(+)--arginine ADP-ribosyltransferase n=1 Tax=Polarella glacialis TaxID=89957 RepID=A0A813FSB4_POLGL|nr:unnamed protein product [Polarella glacialis]
MLFYLILHHKSVRPSKVELGRPRQVHCNSITMPRKKGRPRMARSAAEESEVGEASGWYRALRMAFEDTEVPTTLEAALLSMQPLLQEELDAEGIVEIAEGCVDRMRRKLPSVPHGDSIDVQKAAAINAYTLNEPAIHKYCTAAFTASDRLRGRRPSAKVLQCMPFYVLLDAALRHLPEYYRYKGRVYRGMKWCFPTPQDHSPEVLCDYFYEGRKVIWFVPKSTSQDLRVMETEDFCGLVGARTIFHVQASLGFNIERFSAFAREKNIVIPMFAQMEVLHVERVPPLCRPDIVAMRQLEAEEEADWQRAPSMPIKRTGLAAAVLGGKLYVLGGSNDNVYVETLFVERFDPRAGWQRAPSMPTWRNGLAAAVLDGQLYALGGSARGGNALDTVERFDPGAGWQRAPSMTTERTGLAAAVLDGQLYALGGYARGGNARGGKDLDTVERFDPRAGWQRAPSMPTKRYDLAAAVLDGQLYALGGHDDDFYGGNALDTVERFDPRAGWQRAPSMPTKRSGLAAAVLDGQLYALGGRDDFGRYLYTVERFDPRAGWQRAPSMPTERNGLAAAVLDGQLYALGGYLGGYLDTVERF